MKKIMRPDRWNKKAKYQAFHIFARRHFKSENKCEICKDTTRKMYHWAAKNHKKGGRNREEWLRLCVPCHSLYDGRTGRKLSDDTKRKIGEKNAINSLGNTNAKGHKLSLAKRKEISKKTKLGMLKRKMLLA